MSCLSAASRMVRLNTRILIGARCHAGHRDGSLISICAVPSSWKGIPSISPGLRTVVHVSNSGVETRWAGRRWENDWRRFLGGPRRPNRRLQGPGRVLHAPWSGRTPISGADQAAASPLSAYIFSDFLRMLRGDISIGSPGLVVAIVDDLRRRPQAPRAPGRWRCRPGLPGIISISAGSSRS